VRDRRPDEPESDFRFEHDIPGEPWEGTMPGLAQAAREQMTGSAIFLDVDKAETMLAQFQETARFRGWTLRAVAIMYNHYHLVIQVTDDPDPGKIHSRIGEPGA